MGNFAYDDLEKEEVDIAINYSINMALRNLFNESEKTQRSTSKDGFEDLVLRADDFSVLKEEDYALTNLITVGTKVKGDLPGNYYKLINDRSVLNKPNCDSVERPNRLTDSEFVHEILMTELGKTRSESPVSTMAKDKLTVYTDGFTVTQVLIDYYRKPAVINFNNPPNGAGVIEFSDNTCYKIAQHIARVCAIWLEQPQLKIAYLKAVETETD